MTDKARRGFIKQVAVSGASLGLWLREPASAATSTARTHVALPEISGFIPGAPDVPFVPRRVASWWVTIEDLQWSQKHIRDKIKRRAEAFAAAKIDMVVNYGFHIRFDFSNYFGQ